MSRPCGSVRRSAGVLLGSLLANLVAIVVLTACTDALQAGGCVSDTGCAAASVCAFGRCENPNINGVGAVHLNIEPPATTGLPTQAALNVDLSAGRADVALKPAVTLTGRTEVDGVGVGAQVLLLPDTGVLGRALVVVGDANGDGAFSLVAVKDAHYAVTVRPADATLPPLYDDVGVTATATVTGGARELPAYALQVGALVVRGRVVAGVGAQRQGVPGLDVRMSDPALKRRVSSLARTDATGAFAISVFGPNIGLVVEVRASEANAYYPAVDLAAGDITADTDLGDVEMGDVLSPAAVVVQLLTSTGAAAAGASISARGQVGAGTFSARTTSDAQGLARLQLPPGTYALVVVGAVGDSTSGVALVDAMQLPAEQALTISVPPPVRFTSTVIGPEGGVAAASVSAVRIGAVDGAHERQLEGIFVGYAATSDDNGAFTLDVAPGTYRVTITPQLSNALPVVSRVVTVPPLGLLEDFVLPPRAFVTGRVTFDGNAAPDAYVRLFGDGVDETGSAIKRGEAQAGPDGTFEIVVAVE